MSMYSGLTRLADWSVVTKDGELADFGLDTGDETPVKVDEREDVDINRLVAQQGARAMVPPAASFADLTEIPASRGEAEARLMRLEDELRPLIRPGDSLESALARTVAQARELFVTGSQAPASERNSNAVRAGSDKPADAPAEAAPSPAKG